MTKLYKGIRDRSGCSVTVNGEALALAEPAEKRDNLLPARKFAWGDDSDASKYLAYCILNDYAPHRASSRRIAQAFHQDFIKQIRDDAWQLTNEELDEGIRFWDDMMRIAPPIVAGEAGTRLTPIPAFIYRVLIKRAKLPGGTIKPEQVDEALKRLGEMRGADAETALIAEVPLDYAPILRPAH